MNKLFFILWATVSISVVAGLKNLMFQVTTKLW